VIPHRKGLTLVTFWCIVAAAAWVLPWGYGGDDATAASDTSASEPSPSPSHVEETVSPSPEPQPVETVTVTPTPEPTTAPSPEPEVEEKKPITPLVATIGTSIGASPTAIEIGDTTTITASLTNSGDSPATNAGLTISVPKELVVGPTTPDPDVVDVDPGGNSALVYEFGTLGVGDTKTVQFEAEGDDDPGSPVIVEAAGRADGGLQEFAQAAITVTEPDPVVRISDPRGPGFAQVGESVGYNLTVRNPGQVPATNLAIVYLVPSEIHVQRAGLPKGVDAVQIGIFKGKEDVVWAIDKLGPGKTVKVNWQGVVVGRGDLAARSTARAEADGKVVDSSGSSTYLADEAGTASRNPHFEPVVRRVVIKETVTVTPPSQRRPSDAGVAGSSSELPFTGGTPSRIVTIAIALLMFGTLLVVLSSKRLRGRRVVVGCVALLAVATACFAQDPPPDRVKGETITRNGNGPDGDGEGQDDQEGGDDQGILDDPALQPQDEDQGAGGRAGGAGDPSDDVDLDDALAGPAAVVPVAPEPQTRVVRRVGTRTIGEDDLQIGSATSIAGVSRSVSGSGGGAGTVTRVGAARLRATVAPEGDHQVATVVMTNMSRLKRLQVNGNLLLKVAGFGTLRGGGVNRVLNPNGEVTAHFEFRLPAGSFTIQPSFSAA
jgi:uncharacterized repeat protein (TIGR01451 family)